MKGYLLLIGLSVLIVSCKKDKAPEPDTPPVAQASVNEYYPLDSGNYWIYKQTRYDTSGNLLQTYSNDSTVVEGDTVINGKTYHKVVEYSFLGQTPLYRQYYRDSADCIVNELGKVVFGIGDGLIYQNILTPDTVAYVNYYFNSTPTNITVPLGTYNCVDFRGEVFRKEDNFSKAYPVHRYSHKNVGVIKKTAIYVGQLHQLHWDLVAYHVK